MREWLRVCTASPYRTPGTIVAFTLALFSAALLSSTAVAQPGDMNCDGVVSGLDVPLFVEALLGATDFGGCDISRADTNSDSLIDGRDLQSFVGMLLGPLCPPPLVYCGECVDTTYNNAHCGGCFIVCGSMETCVGGVCEPSQPCPECGLR